MYMLLLCWHVHVVVLTQGYKEQRKFIVAQSPLPNTSRDFWKMVYERNCGSIVMLCGMTEDEEVHGMHMHVT